MLEDKDKLQPQLLVGVQPLEAIMVEETLRIILVVVAVELLMLELEELL